MSISKLTSLFKDYARSNLFSIRFTRDIGKSEIIDFAIKSSKFPSIQMAAPELEFRGFKMPTVGPTRLGEFEITLVIDEDMNTYKYFSDWLNEIINEVDGTGKAFLTPLEAVEATIYQLDSDLSQRAYITLSNVYPSNISEISLAEEESIMQFTVTFKYTNFKRGYYGSKR